MVSSSFHSGEVAVQKRVGVREQARDLEGMYRNAVPPAVAEFLAHHPFAVLSSADAQGNVWASPLAGRAIFSVPDAHTVQVHLDRLEPTLDPSVLNGTHAGLLVIDFDRRLRLRINGTITRKSDSLALRVAEFYGNCQKYIQRRVPVSAPTEGGRSQTQNLGTGLTGASRDLISRTDTFFIATHHEDTGGDASHRGGPQGFVTIKDDRTLIWPDYRGNNMFNTLGNLETDARAGLLFVDFDSGASLELSGRAVADFGDPSSFSPTGRSVRFEIAAIRELPPSPFLRYSLVEAFPYNPPVSLSPAP